MDTITLYSDAPRHDKTRDNAQFLEELRAIVGSRYVLTSPESTRRYRTGFRFGTGPALAVVRPDNLVEQWKVLKACAAANKIIIMQAANTGITGGSTPDGGDYDREIIIVSTMRMAKIRLIKEGRQVICHPGATLHELERGTGKAMIFAVRLDTFPRERETKVFYIGTNEPAELTEIRRHILAHFKDLPIEGEYLHRVAFDIAEKYGKDTFLAIRYLGTDRLPALFALKGRFDAFAGRLRFFPHDLSDRVMQAASHLFPRHLPKRMTEYRDRFEHQLMLKMAGTGIDDARRLLQPIFPSDHGDFFECEDDEGEKAFLHRFAAAGAAIRYRAIHRREVEDLVALDIALRRNDRNWVETLPDDITRPITHRLYYGHFFCHGFHQDYIVRKGRDPVELEHRMWKLLDARGAEYPAEHNVGHLYVAKPALRDHYRRLDPCNCFNPGVGRTSKHAHWRLPASDQGAAL